MMRTQTEIDSKHGNRAFTERRLSVDEQIAFYEMQAKLARAGVVTRQTPEYFDRQVTYFRLVKAGEL
jgi:hypothetical protein